MRDNVKDQLKGDPLTGKILTELGQVRQFEM